MKRIFINMPKRQYRVLQKKIDASVLQVFDSDYYLQGPFSEKFSKRFAQYCQATYCLPLGNGTDALELALRSLDLPKDSYCMTVANAGGYTSIACHLVGLIPQYIDVKENTLVMDIDLVSRIVTKKTRVIVATHLYGNVVDVAKLKRILRKMKRSDIVVIEDCAQCHGGLCRGKKVGSLGDIGTFSFYPTKNLGAIGDAGAIVTNSKKCYEKIKLLYQYGWKTRYDNSILFGRNSRMDEVQAAILCVKLPFLDRWNAKRRKIIKAYENAVSDSIRVITQSDDSSVCHLAIFQAKSTKQRDDVLRYMEKNGVIGGIHYPTIDCDQVAWKYLKSRRSDLSVSRNAVQRLFTLPCFPEMRDKEVRKICDLLR